MLHILKDNWLLTGDSIELYSQLANDILAGKEISTGMFSTIILPTVPENIALIPISGVMTKADVCGGQGTQSIAQEIAQAAIDSSKTAIILYYESVPGGQVDGTKNLTDTIKAAAAQKPVLTAISGMSCSAGVWSSAYSTEIYATSPTDQIGCIGVVARLKKSGTTSDEYEEVYADGSPDKNAEFRNVEILKNNFLNPVCELFQNDVVAGRGKALKQSVLSGATYIAADAKKHGLINGIMPFDKIVQRANYLSKKNKTMSTNAQALTPEAQAIAEAQIGVFNNVLQIAGADAAIPVEEGFALTEAQMRTADDSIATLQDTVQTQAATITSQTEQIETLTAQLAEANNTLNINAATIAEQAATIAEYAGKPAPVAPLPAAAADPINTGKDPYHTSIDDEAIAHRKKLGV